MQHLGNGLVHVWKFGGAGQRIAAFRDGPRRARREPSRQRPAPYRPREPRRCRQPSPISWNSARRAAAELISQRLHAAGAGGRIGDTVEVRFLDEDQLGIARDAASEGVRQADGRRPGLDHDVIGAPTPAAKTAVVVRSQFTAGSTL